jgi:hypothetical protein
MMTSLPIFALFGAALGHTLISSPEPREKRVHGYSGGSTGGENECGTSSAIKNYWKRGQKVDIEWARNNHQGGFVQFSVLPLSSSNPNRDIEEFDDPKNIVYVTCYDKPSCKAQGGGDEFGLGGDGMGEWQNVCKDSFTVPDYLEDGDYVMKSTVFGNGDSNGVRNMAHPTYSNCHNFRVSGGNTLASKACNNEHIAWDLNDHSIDQMNSRKGWNIAQGQCLFLGSNQHNHCLGGGRNPRCIGPVAEVTRCGEGKYAESRQDCAGNRGGQGGDQLYNWMVGLPMNHPKFTGELTMISHVRNTKTVQIDVPNRGASPCPSPGSKPGPSPGGDGSDGDTIIFISLGAQTLVSMWSALPLLVSVIALLKF